jgi:hypothetical protein
MRTLAIITGVCHMFPCRPSYHVIDASDQCGQATDGCGQSQMGSHLFHMLLECAILRVGCVRS